MSNFIQFSPPLTSIKDVFCDFQNDKYFNDLQLFIFQTHVAFP